MQQLGINGAATASGERPAERSAARRAPLSDARLIAGVVKRN